HWGKAARTARPAVHKDDERPRRQGTEKMLARNASLFPALVVLEETAPFEVERGGLCGQATADGRVVERLGDYRIVRDVDMTAVAADADWGVAGIAAGVVDDVVALAAVHVLLTSLSRRVCIRQTSRASVRRRIEEQSAHGGIARAVEVGDF